MKYHAKVTIYTGVAPVVFAFQNIYEYQVRQWLDQGYIGMGTLKDEGGSVTETPQTIIPLGPGMLLDVTPMGA